MLCVNTVQFLVIVLLSVEAITGKSSTNTMAWTAAAATAVIFAVIVGFSQAVAPGVGNTYQHRKPTGLGPRGRRAGSA